MQLIEIVGPPASGKTTVMRALQRLTSFEAYAFVEEAAASLGVALTPEYHRRATVLRERRAMQIAP